MTYKATPTHASASPLTMTSRTTLSPWATLIDQNRLPHLPAALTEPCIAQKAIVDACLVVAGRRRFEFLDYPETAEELASRIPTPRKPPPSCSLR